jgi:hypothetical protein
VVCGRAAGVQPLGLVAAILLGALHQAIHDEIGDTAQDLIEHRRL